MATKEVEIKVTSDTSNARKDIGALDSQTKKTDKSTVNLTKAFKTAGIAVTAIAGTVAGLVASYRTQEQAERRLGQVLKNTGFAAGFSANELTKMASGLQEVTTVGDETIIKAQSLLLTFDKVGKETFPRALEASLDLAEGLGTDLDGATRQLGRALQEPVRGLNLLTRAGVNFTGEQKELVKELVRTGDVAGAQAIILGGVEKSFGGLAREAAGGTGALIQTKNLLGDIAESGGKVLLPFVLKLNDALKDAAKFWNDFAGSIASSSTEELNEQIKGLEESTGDLEAKFLSLRDRAKSLGAADVSLFGSKSAAQEAEEVQKVWLAQVEQLNSLRSQLKISEQKEFSGSVEAREQANRDAEEETKRFNASLLALREEFNLVKDEGNLTELEALENQLKQEEFLKLESQIRDIQSTQGQSEALNKIQQETNKERFKNLKEQNKKELAEAEAAAKAKIALEQATVDAKIDILSNFGNLAATLGRKDSKLAFTIQKAAAIASAVVATQRAAALALPNIVLSKLLLVSGGLNVAAIAAQTIKGFNQGGLVSGGISNRDTIPAMLSKGEIVAPEKNFDEVIEGVARLRGFTREKQASTQSVQEVIIGFRDNAFELIESKLLERDALGV